MRQPGDVPHERRSDDAEQVSSVIEHCSWISDFARDYFCEIVKYMVAEFGITEEEAIGRVNYETSHWDIYNPNFDDMLGHEEPAYWAHNIYYGHNSHWWRVSRETLEPLPWRKD
ncbi:MULTISPECIES: hypothetical protein [Amycolatopsis]|uniref:hypothetical protein n=1 Tax=Amycolatopsis TaxID=1813 RepID=UPI0011774F2B|nr:MULTISPECIES: hypothetical protein [Amycolatopsis]